jgi:cation:H+ antiporter
MFAFLNLPYVLVLIGLLMLIFGAKMLVNSAIEAACRLKISKLIIGLTIVALGTSMPELFVSVKAALIGSSSIVLGNIIGSNLVNLMFILGFTAMLSSVLIDKKEFLFNYKFLAISTVLMSFFLFAFKTINFWHGIILIAVLVKYLYLSYKKEKQNNVQLQITEAEDDERNLKKYSIFIVILLAIVGLITLFFGAELLVNNAVIIAKKLNISEEIIGLTLVAIGTSLPEFVVSVVSVLKKQHEIVLGNIIGSNILNILLILGLTLIIHPVNINSSEIFFDLAFLIIATAMIYPLATRKNKLCKVEGAFLLIFYILFLIFRIRFFS